MACCFLIETVMQLRAGLRASGLVFHDGAERTGVKTLITGLTSGRLGFTQGDDQVVKRELHTRSDQLDPGRQRTGDAFDFGLRTCR